MIEKTVMDLLSGLVAGSVYFDKAMAEAKRPYIIIQQAGGEAVEFLEGPSGKDLVRLQVDVYAETRTEANEVMTLARQQLLALHASAIGAPFSLFEPAVALYRRSCDFRILAPS